MRIITLNVNGLRSAERKGFARWLARVEPWDVVCLQEIKCLDCDVPRSLTAPRKSHATFHSAQRKGYSGVALYAKAPPRIATGFGHAEFDPRRTLSAGRFRRSVGDQRLPAVRIERSASAGVEVSLSRGLPAASREHCVKSGREVVLCGDWNIAHQPIDLRNWRSNQKNSGFLPEERAWLTRVFDELGFVDVFRRVDPRPDQYTWWSNRGQAWAKNVGWRIDYQMATPGIAATARAVSIYRNRRFSDHAPLIVDYDFELR